MSGTNTRVGAVITVKDDIELLRLNLAYHSAVGVDCFVLCDRGSSPEGQRELEAMAEADNIHLLRQYVYERNDLDRAAMKQVRLASVTEVWNVFSPDWVFATDTDEFWVPKSGDIGAAVASTELEHMQVERFNAAILRDDVQTVLDRVSEPGPLGPQQVIVGREVLTVGPGQVPAKPFVFHAIMSKCVSSINDVVEVMPGFHDMGYRRDVRRGSASDLAILHLPFTSFERFLAKVEGARKHLTHLGDALHPGHGWHWRYWVSLPDEAAIRAEFDHQFLSPLDLQTLCDDGTVQSFDDYFATSATG